LLLSCTTTMNNIESKRESKRKLRHLHGLAICQRPQEYGYIQ